MAQGEDHGPNTRAKDKTQRSPQEYREKAAAKNRLSKEPAGYRPENRPERHYRQQTEKSAEDRAAHRGKQPEEQSAPANTMEYAEEEPKACPRNSTKHGHDGGGNPNHVGGAKRRVDGRPDCRTVDGADNRANNNRLGPPMPCRARGLELVQIEIEKEHPAAANKEAWSRSNRWISIKDR